MNEDEFSQYIAPGHEQRSVEFKGAGTRTNKQLLVQVVKAAIGMANNRDGGIIIVGIDENNEGTPQLTGLNPDELKTWSFDALADSFAEYTDPTILFEIEAVEFKLKKFLVIHVQEFLDSPVICKKSYPEVLRSGACYVRPRRKPETTEPPSHADMQDLLSLAIEKGIRRFIAQARSAGFDLTGEKITTDRNLFDKQVDDLVNFDSSSDLLKKISSRGYWITRIFPKKFDPKKIKDIGLLSPIIQKAVVRIRGWDFPHINPNNQLQIGLDYVGQEIEWEHTLSSWRFYQSGQFIQISCIPIDWRDQSSFWPPTEDWKPGMLLGIGDTVASFTEVFELASRLAITDAGEEIMHISMIIGNIKDRMLYVDSPRRWPLDYPRRATINEYPIELEITRPELVADGKTKSLEQSLEFFRRFGFDTTIEILRSWQEKIGR